MSAANTNCEYFFWINNGCGYNIGADLPTLNVCVSDRIKALDCQKKENSRYGGPTIKKK